MEDMKVNEKPHAIMREAAKKAEEFYPIGTVVEVRLRPNWTPIIGQVVSCFEGDDFRIRNVDSSITYNFYPSLHPHRIVSKGRKGGD